jgi:RHS repeat-associated protein
MTLSSGTWRDAYSDPDIGLVYDNARYLNVGTGRFWTMDGERYGNSEDPLSLHKYLYCADDPPNGIDPSGHDDNLVEEETADSEAVGLGQFAARVAVQGMTFALKNPGLLRAFLIAQGFITIYGAHEDPGQAYLYFETGGFAADAKVAASVAGDLRSAFTLYKDTDSLGRSCGIFCVLTKNSLKGGTEVPDFLNVPGVKVGSDLQRGHLRAAMLGGLGERLENLTAIYRSVNNGSMKRIEFMVRRAVRSGETVQYRVTPIFSGNNLIPKYIKIEAKGDKGFQLGATFSNVP